MKRTYGVWLHNNRIGVHIAEIAQNTLITAKHLPSDAETIEINYDPIDYSPVNIKLAKDIQNNILNRSVVFSIPHIKTAWESVTYYCWFNGCVFDNSQVLFMLPLIDGAAKKLYGDYKYINVFNPFFLEVQPLTYTKTSTTTELAFQIRSPMQLKLVFDPESLNLERIESKHINYLFEMES